MVTWSWYSRIFLPVFLLFCAASVLFLIEGTTGRAQEVNSSRLQIQIEPPRIRGGMRYGHWAPLRVNVTQGASGTRFSGTVVVTGPNGFRTSEGIDLSAGRSERQLTVPVFGNTSLPVFRARLLNEEGTELDRAQRRFRQVFGPETSVIGLSTAFSQSVRASVRDRIKEVVSTDVVFISSPRSVLTDLGQWPGIFDLVYLKRSAELPVRVVTDTERSIRPATKNTRIPQVRTVDSNVYDVFERPEVSAERKQWMRNAILVGLFVLLSGLFLCFYRPSSPMNWGLLLGVSLGTLAIVYITLPERPTVIRQTVSVRVSDAEYGTVMRDQRVALYPHARRRSSGKSGKGQLDQSSENAKTKRKLQYPIGAVRRTIPVFYNEDALPSRFPELRKNGAQRSFYWSSFPEEGYFVLQEFEQLRSRNFASVKVEERSNGLTIQNHSGTELRNGWVRMNKHFLQFGRIPDGESRTISQLPSNESSVDSREQFIEQAFTTGDRQQRIMRRWTKYVLQLYDRDQPVVLGILNRSRPTNRNFPSGFGQVQMPELLFHRFRYEEGTK